jgi:hypothetical protein
MWAGIRRGALAGAAGTTALNAVTYLDMAWRGRSSSSTPERTVERISEISGRPVPGDERTRGNRLTGLGSLMGMAAGVGIGMAVGALRSAGLRLPDWLEPAAVGVLAMTATDAPMAAAGVTDPREWSGQAWVSDLIPHLAYGVVTHWALAATDA